MLSTCFFGADYLSLYYAYLLLLARYLFRKLYILHIFFYANRPFYAYLNSVEFLRIYRPISSFFYEIKLPLAPVLFFVKKSFGDHLIRFS